MSILRVKANGTGRVVSWNALKRGELRDASPIQRMICLTTVLPDVINDVLETTKNADPHSRVTCVVANGPTSASLDLAIIGSDFEVTCARRLVRGMFPLNPFAAEFGRNYDVVVTINATPAMEASLTTRLRSRYQCSECSRQTGRDRAQQGDP